MTSRASPSRRSSGVMFTSMPTVSPPSVATVQPDRGVWVTMMSSGPSATGLPSTSRVTLPAERISLASEAGSASLIAAATAGVPLPNRRPRLPKFGLTT